MNRITPPPHPLAQVQRWMQTAIVHPAGIEEGINSAAARQEIDIDSAEIENVLTSSQAQTALERLSIYGSAYYARLLECLREEFPVLLHALGEDIFDGFGVGYLQAYPSRSYTLFKLSTDFPRYLAETSPVPDLVSWPQFLIDLATLEVVFNEVFDGPGIENTRLLDVDQLGAVSKEQLPDARLVGVPC